MLALRANSPEATVPAGMQVLSIIVCIVGMYAVIIGRRRIPLVRASSCGAEKGCSGPGGRAPRGHHLTA